MINVRESGTSPRQTEINQRWISLVSSALIFSADRLFRKHFEGLEHLNSTVDYVNEGRGGLFVTPNHNSFIDSYLMRLVRRKIIPEKRFVVLWANKFTGKDEGKYAGTGQEDLRKVSIAGKIGKEAARQVNIELIDVPQDTSDIASARKALKNLETIGQNVLGNNHVLGVFPEGTRSRNGQLGMGKRGLVYLFKDQEINARTLILPMAATGTGEFLSPDSEKLNPFVLLTIIYGKPYFFEQAKQEMETYGLSLETIIMWHIGQLLPENRWGVYKDVFSKIRALEQKNQAIR